LLIQTRALADLITLTEPQRFNELLQRYHFTVHQRQQLKNQLLRWDVLSNQQPLLMDDKDLMTGKDVLRSLELRINTLDFTL